MSGQARNPQGEIDRFQALTEMLQAMDRKYGEMLDRMERLEVSVAMEQPPNAPNPTMQPRRVPRRVQVDDDFDDSESLRDNRKEEEVRPRARNNHNNSNNGVKLKIPSFHGRMDPEAYLDWEKKTELVFDCNDYTESKKLKLVVAVFEDYAITWWDDTKQKRRRNRERPIEEWRDLKSIMQRRFVPSYYYRELYNRLHNLTQGSKSVEDYYKEMEVAMIRANVEEDNEATMARFLNSLNKEISNVVELQPYMELEDLLHLALKVEKQLKKRGSTNRSFSYTSSFKSNWRKDEKASSSKPKIESKKAPKTSNLSNDKGKLDSTINTRNIKCFKCQGVGHYKRDCPNQRNIFLLDGEYYSASEDENGEEMMPPLEDAGDEEGEE